MGRFIKSSILVLVVLTTFTFFTKAQDWLPQMPSVLLKLLPKPKFEKNNLEGSGDNGRVIDLQGGWLNEGKLTELVIRSKEA
jgi:hypothetical protein